MSDEKVMNAEKGESHLVLPPLRSMTQAEIAMLRQKGMDTMFMDKATYRMGVEMSDLILKTIYPDFDFGPFPYNECLELASKIYYITYGRKLDEKK